MLVKRFHTTAIFVLEIRWIGEAQEMKVDRADERFLFKGKNYKW